MTSIRIDSETKKISVIDTIRKLLASSTDDKEKSCTIQHLSRRIKTHADREGIDLEYRFRINGRDSPTCVASLNAVNQFVASFRCSVPEASKLSLLEELRVTVSPPPSNALVSSAAEIANTYEARTQEIRDSEIMDVDMDTVVNSTVDTTIDTIVDTNNILQGIRVDTATGLGSVIDVIQMLNPNLSLSNVHNYMDRLLSIENGISTNCRKLVINGKGHSTPVADAKTLVEIVWLCPGKAAREFRRKSAQTICRVLGGDDLTLIDEIEQRQPSVVNNISANEHETRNNDTMDIIGIVNPSVDTVVDITVDANNILQGIRVDKATKLGSVIDVIQMVNPEIERKNAFVYFKRLCDQYTYITTNCSNICINNVGKSTPVADAKTLVEIVFLLPGKAAREFRRKSAQTICRVLGGDLTIINEIENRHQHLQQSDEGRAAQNFLLPSEDKMDTIQEPQIPLFLQMATANQKNAYVQSCLDDHIKQMGKQFELKQKQFEVKQRDLEMKQKESEIKFIQQGWAFLQELGTDDRDMIYTKDLVKRCIDSSISSVPLSNTSQLVVASKVSTESQAIEPDDPSVPTPVVHPRYRGQEISMHTVASEIGIRIKSGTEGRIGKEMKRLYAERYGGDAARNIPTYNIPFRGQMLPGNIYYSRDSGMMEQAIRSVE